MRASGHDTGAHLPAMLPLQEHRAPRAPERTGVTAPCTKLGVLADLTAPADSNPRPLLPPAWALSIPAGRSASSQALPRSPGTSQPGPGGSKGLLHAPAANQ